MKKILSLTLAFVLLFTVFSAVPTASAEEATYTPIDEDFGRMFWEELYDATYLSNLDIVKADNWYYAYAKSYYVDSVIIYVCGYEGNETEITIPTKFDGKQIKCLEEFYLLSNTVKTINIPKEIVSIDGEADYDKQIMEDESRDPFKVYTPVIECGDSPLKEIVVDSENPNYKSEDGVLLTKNGKRLIYYPDYKADEKYAVPDTVRYISHAAFKCAKNLKSLTISPNVVELGYESIPQKTLEELRYENTHLPQYSIKHSEAAPEIEYPPSPTYVPDIRNTVVYCVEGSNMYKEYEDSFGYPEAMCKELKVLPPFTETLIKESDGKWYYYCNDYKMYDSTLVKYKGKWFYVTNGVWDKTVTDKVVTYKNKSFYIKNGKWDSSVNTLTKKNGEWLGIVNGKCDNSVNTLIKYKGKWFYVKNGEWCKKTAIVKYKGKRFYVKNGKVDFDFSGKKKIDGKTYKIKNGKVA